ncbi:MAG TPA: DUF305 domain-containing protein, partial [Deinococcales bacterium]|nr:DUF305 domain-containing protein [Deinococcales bacterium]
MKRTAAAFLVTAILAGSSTSLAQGMGMGGGMMGQGGMGAGMMGGQTGMMGHSVTSEADFLNQMIPHHEEAVATARQLLAVTRRPELRQLLQNIISSQTREIVQMRLYLARWHRGTQTADYQPMMSSLEGLSAADAESRFLEEMVMHHMMAVHMAQGLLNQNLATHPEVRTLAENIIRDQQNEIRQMMAWRADWFGVAGMGPMMGQGGGMMQGNPQQGQGGMMGHGGQGMMGQGGMMQPAQPRQGSGLQPMQPHQGGNAQPMQPHQGGMMQPGQGAGPQGNRQIAPVQPRQQLVPIQPRQQVVPVQPRQQALPGANRGQGRNLLPGAPRAQIRPLP